jgi:hypothetical protein
MSSYANISLFRNMGTDLADSRYTFDGDQNDLDAHLGKGPHGPIAGGNYDPQLDMFQDLEASVPGTFGRMFKYRYDDDVVKLCDQPYDGGTCTSSPFNSGSPSQLLTEYEIAYISLGAGVDRTYFIESYVNGNFLGPLASGNVGKRPGWWVGGVWESTWLDPKCNAGICNVGVDEACSTDAYCALIQPAWVNYTPDAGHVTSIADAHCRLASVKSAYGAAVTDSAYSQFQTGDYSTALDSVDAYAAGLGSTTHCPSECAADNDDKCSAPWH